MKGCRSKKKFPSSKMKESVKVDGKCSVGQAEISWQRSRVLPGSTGAATVLAWATALEPASVGWPGPGPTLSPSWLPLSGIDDVISLFSLFWGWRWWHVAVGCGRGNASLSLLVKDQHGWTPLEAWVASLTRPVPVTGLA